jgi:hypothetical protein
MKKKDRSPAKPQASPNPRPKRRNKKQRESMAKPKKKESLPGTPLQTPIQTPEHRTHGNSFELLQNDSDDEDASPATINSNDPQVEIESIPSDSETAPAQSTSNPDSPASTEPDPISTPDAIKQRPTSNGPIAEIPPTNKERLGTSIPLFASQLAKTAGKLFPEANQVNSKQESSMSPATNLKPPPVASLPSRSSTPTNDKQLAIDIFGDDAKPPAIN